MNVKARSMDKKGNTVPQRLNILCALSIRIRIIVAKDGLSVFYWDTELLKSKLCDFCDSCDNKTVTGPHLFTITCSLCCRYSTGFREDTITNWCLLQECAASRIDKLKPNITND